MNELANSLDEVCLDASEAPAVIGRALNVIEPSLNFEEQLCGNPCDSNGIGLIGEFKSYGVEIFVVAPPTASQEVMHEYGV